MKLILHVVVNALAIAFTAWVLPGITVINNDIGTYILIGIVFGLLNAILKPILQFLTCPLIILTLGLFALVINGLMLWWTAELLPERLMIENFWWAVAGGLIMAVVGTMLQGMFGLKDDKDED